MIMMMITIKIMLIIQIMTIIINCPEAGYCAKALSLEVRISQYLLTLNGIEVGYILLGLYKFVLFSKI